MSEPHQSPTCQMVSEPEKPEDNSSAKRPREDSSDVEVDLPSKKACIEELSNDKNSSSKGTKEHENESIQVDEKKAVESDIKHKETASNDATSITVVSEKMSIDLKDASHSGEKEIVKSQDDEDTDRKNVTENGIVNGKHEETNTKDEMFINDESNQNVKLSTCKKNKNRKEDSEIINGVELTVECASDKESSEQSEEEKSEKPKTKTIIVREKPNNSEVDASSSDAEKSNSSNASKIKSSHTSTSLKVMKKKSAEKGKIKSSTNLSSTSENSAESSSNDEDYSPIAKKVKKSSPKKNANNPKDAKRGIGRPRGRPPKNSKNVLEKPLDKESREEKINENIEKKINKKSKDSSDNTESKNEESTSALSTNGKSDNESNNGCGFNKSEEKGRKISKRNLTRIHNLKKYIKAAGIRVNYKTLLEDCKTDAAKVRILSHFLEEHGIVGRPSMEKCAKLKKKNETEKEVQELDTNNIISETRVTRGARNVRKSKVESKVPASPVQKLRNRIKAVVDSDSE